LFHVLHYEAPPPSSVFVGKLQFFFFFFPNHPFFCGWIRSPFSTEQLNLPFSLLFNCFYYEKMPSAIAEDVLFAFPLVSLVQFVPRLFLFRSSYPRTHRFRFRHFRIPLRQLELGRNIPSLSCPGPPLLICFFSNPSITRIHPQLTIPLRGPTVHSATRNPTPQRKLAECLLPCLFVPRRLHEQESFSLFLPSPTLQFALTPKPLARSIFDQLFLTRDIPLSCSKHSQLYVFRESSFLVSSFWALFF